MSLCGFNSLGYIAGVRVGGPAGSDVTLRLTFGETAKLCALTLSAGLFYVTTSKVRRFQLLRIFVNTYYCLVLTLVILTDV